MKRFIYTNGFPVDRNYILILKKGSREGYKLLEYQMAYLVIRIDDDGMGYTILKNRWGRTGVHVNEPFNLYDFVE